jgi:hypothetical protein
MTASETATMIHHLRYRMFLSSTSIWDFAVAGNNGRRRIFPQKSRALL